MRQMTEFEKFQDEVYFQRVREMELTARQAELRWRDILWEKLKTICWSIGWTEQEMVCAGSPAGMPWEALNGAIDLLRSTIQDCLGLGAEEGIDWCRGLEWAECV